MSSIQKPPLPSNISIVGMMPGPELRDLFHFNGTKKRGDEFNKKIDEANERAWADFYKQLDAWKRSQSKMLTLNKTPELNAEINIE